MSKSKPSAGVSQVDLVSIDMGYGHLSPAYALSEFLGKKEVLLADQPPLATPDEQRIWRRARTGYELLSITEDGPGPAGTPSGASILQTKLSRIRRLESHSG